MPTLLKSHRTPVSQSRRKSLQAKPREMSLFDLSAKARGFLIACFEGMTHMSRIQANAGITKEIA